VHPWNATAQLKEIHPVPDLSGSPLTPTVPELILERRTQERYRSRRCPFVRVLARPSFQPYEAIVYDVSLSSLGIVLHRDFDPGTLLAIQLQVRHAGFSGILTGKVVHSTLLADQNWLIGCTLSRSLSEEELTSLL
jgi:hypothetical protein